MHFEEAVVMVVVDTRCHVPTAGRTASLSLQVLEGHTLPSAASIHSEITSINRPRLKDE